MSLLGPDGQPVPGPEVALEGATKLASVEYALAGTDDGRTLVVLTYEGAVWGAEPDTEPVTARVVMSIAGLGILVGEAMVLAGMTGIPLDQAVDDHLAANPVTRTMSTPLPRLGLAAELPEID